ncbi:PQQ-dependent sugar dehydrogenase [Natrinema sp. 1APR25-10V2]|uniref:PQQ-dependent sugar dehydrogenase n=1 Tax=Natrinema sp. 1APR25-10V2 TaxID=2951081 RepID=UPI002876D19A|nr:PQQ-dependent sugar dehydrogenase [Natrinema sp. 1APR25-10V2]MDS0477900.1 PQQ-dependent sugar dehydrogenase [Natrinema sp. 1APR25-10V2]
MRTVQSRRRFLMVAAAGAAGTVGSARRSAVAQESNDRADGLDRLPDAIGLEPVTDELAFPLAVEFAPDADRRYVAERDGRIRVHESDGLRDELLLDLRETVLSGGERGLLGMVLHPEFGDNRRLFVHFSAPRRSGTPQEFDHTGILAAFEASADGRRVKRDSSRVVLEIPQPADFHNGGGLAFGPDGYLYVGIGAGGGGGGGGQDVTTDFLGSVLRIDVDERAADRAYTVPDDNPLVGRDGLDEYYAWGFRNPWRLSFDGEDCYVADVGESDYEEVNLVEKGGNYGWNVREGTQCFKADDCPERTADGVRGGERFRDPIIEYPHPPADTAVSGVSVIGGYVYRGTALPALEGAYVFGDFVPSGRLFAAVPSDDGLWPTTAVRVTDGATPERLISFGQDGDGELYALGAGGDGGGVFRIVPTQ